MTKTKENIAALSNGKLFTRSMSCDRDIVKQQQQLEQQLGAGRPNYLRPVDSNSRDYYHQHRHSRDPAAGSNSSSLKPPPCLPPADAAAAAAHHQNPTRSCLFAKEKSLNSLYVSDSLNTNSSSLNKQHSNTSSSSNSISSSSCQIFESSPVVHHPTAASLDEQYQTSAGCVPMPPPQSQRTLNPVDGGAALDAKQAAEVKTSKSSVLSFKYGELVVLGYNGCIDKHFPYQSSKSHSNHCIANSSRRKSKFVLSKRDKANGVRPATQHNCQTTQEVENLMLKNSNQYSVAYTLSRNQTVVVQYEGDEKTDMFQIGRSSDHAIDFIVLDTVVSPVKPSTSPATSMPSTTSASHGSSQNSNESNNSGGGGSQQSTISRYSCRIVVDREPPYTARIYAAGFDTSKRIFLGEKATKWKNKKGQLDGVTTNGVLIMHPTTGFTGADSKSNEWMEVSVCGAVFGLNETRQTTSVIAPREASSNVGGNNIRETTDGNNLLSNLQKSNVLLDGTLIDLCGATLLWRSAESLQRTPTKHYLDMNLEHLNRLKPQCPVGLKTLVFPSSASPIAQQLRTAIIQHQQNGVSLGHLRLDAMLNGNYSKEFKKHLNLASSYYQQLGDRIPMVYLKCGHVHGQHDWGVKKDNERECPLCRKVGPYVQLLVGLEPSFYCDTDIKISNNSNNCTLFRPYAFRPCGHMASEQTCKYWSRLEVPQGTTQGLLPICPFCAVPLCSEQPFVKLIFQEAH